MRNYAWIGAALALLALVGWFAWTDFGTPMDETKPPAVADIDSHIEPSEGASGAPVVAADAGATEPGSRADAADADTDLDALDEAPPARVDRIWDLDDESSFLFDHAIGDYRPDRSGLRLDPVAIRNLAVGDPFLMPLPGIGDVEGTVTWVNESENGDRGIGAIIDSEDDEYTATLTIGRARHLRDHLDARRPIPRGGARGRCRRLSGRHRGQARGHRNHGRACPAGGAPLTRLAVFSALVVALLSPVATTAAEPAPVTIDLLVYYTP